MHADGGMNRELRKASVSKREWKVLSRWTCLWRVWNAVCWHEGRAPVRAALSLHLNSSRLGCDSPSGLELQLLGGLLQPLLVALEVCFSLETLSSHPDGPLTVGLTKWPTRCSWVQNACF